MRIALLTTGRFTLVDLGRELAQLGHEVRLYSLVPSWRTREFGLPDECNVWLGPYVGPIYAASRVARGRTLRSLLDHAVCSAVDRAAARRIEPCDVLIAMSGIGLRSLEAVKRRFGARVFLERSSRHILSQREILEAMPGANEPVPAWAIERELTGYGLADVISVPALHVEQSFLERGFPRERLFRNPFGTSIELFQPTPAPAADVPITILMTGAWSLRKGCDVLTQAWRQLPNTRLLHVGPVVDAPLPQDPGFEHVDKVPQRDLPSFYARAHVFALASREEGLAVVQPQALASGLRLVCTTHSGGGEFASWTRSPTDVTVVRPDDVDGLRDALAAALRDLPPPGTLRDLFGDKRAELSWAAYARRYERKLLEVTSAARPS